MDQFFQTAIADVGAISGKRIFRKADTRGEVIKKKKNTIKKGGRPGGGGKVLGIFFFLHSVGHFFRRVQQPAWPPSVQTTHEMLRSAGTGAPDTRHFLPGDNCCPRLWERQQLYYSTPSSSSSKYF